MRRIIYIILLFLLLHLTASAQFSLNLPGGIRVLNGTPADAKYYNDAGTSYTNTAQVLSQLTSGERGIGLTVNVSGVEYWFEAGITDGDLVVKGGGGGIVTASNGLTAVGSDVQLGGILTGSTLLDTDAFNFTIQGNDGGILLTQLAVTPTQVYSQVANPDGFTSNLSVEYRQVSFNANLNDGFGGTVGGYFALDANSGNTWSFINTPSNLSSDIQQSENGTIIHGEVTQLLNNISVLTDHVDFTAQNFTLNGSYALDPANEFFRGDGTWAVPAGIFIGAANGVFNNSGTIQLGGIINSTVSLDAGAGTESIEIGTSTPFNILSLTASNAVTLNTGVSNSIEVTNTYLNISSNELRVNGNAASVPSTQFLRGDGTWVVPGGGGGITNTAANNEMAKSDGTNLVPSGIFSTASGDLQMGDNSGSLRTLSATSSGLNAGLMLLTKGNGNLFIRPSAQIANRFIIDNSELNFLTTGAGTDISITTASSSGVDANLHIKPAAAKHLYLESGGSGGDIIIANNTGGGSFVFITGLPTSCSGAPTNSIANVAGVLTVCP